MSRCMRQSYCITPHGSSMERNIWEAVTCQSWSSSAASQNTQWSASSPEIHLWWSTFGDHHRRMRMCRGKKWTCNDVVLSNFFWACLTGQSQNSKAWFSVMLAFLDSARFCKDLSLCAIRLAFFDVESYDKVWWKKALALGLAVADADLKINEDDYFPRKIFRREHREH